MLSTAENVRHEDTQQESSGLPPKGLLMCSSSGCGLCIFEFPQNIQQPHFGNADSSQVHPDSHDQMLLTVKTMLAEHSKIQCSSNRPAKHGQNGGKRAISAKNASGSMCICFRRQAAQQHRTLRALQWQRQATELEAEAATWSLLHHLQGDPSLTYPAGTEICVRHLRASLYCNPKQQADGSAVDMQIICFCWMFVEGIAL